MSRSDKSLRMFLVTLGANEDAGLLVELCGGALQPDHPVVHVVHHPAPLLLHQGGHQPLQSHLLVIKVNILNFQRILFIKRHSVNMDQRYKSSSYHLVPTAGHC